MEKKQLLVQLPGRKISGKEGKGCCQAVTRVRVPARAWLLGGNLFCGALILRVSLALKLPQNRE